MTNKHSTYIATASIEELPLALTMDEAAQVLRIGRNAAYGLAKSGTLKCIRIGRKLRIPRQAIEEFLGNPA